MCTGFLAHCAVFKERDALRPSFRWQPQWVVRGFRACAAGTRVPGSALASCLPAGAVVGALRQIGTLLGLIPSRNAMQASRSGRSRSGSEQYRAARWSATPPVGGAAAGLRCSATLPAARRPGNVAAAVVPAAGSDKPGEPALADLQHPASQGSAGELRRGVGQRLAVQPHRALGHLPTGVAAAGA